MLAAMVIAAGAALQWIDHVNASHGEEATPAIHALDLVRVGRNPVRDRFLHRRLGGDGAAAGHLHLHARAGVLDRVRARRSSLHALLRRPHAVLGGHAHDGARARHGAADPRLGDHGPLLVHADRALVGGAGQQPGGVQGLLHRARRRRRAAGRHGDAARDLRHARHPPHQRRCCAAESSTARTS